MNAIEFLIKEHDKVKRILNEIEDDSKQFETKRRLFQEVGHALIRHENMEQDLWYPCFKNNNLLDERVKHLLTEEKHAEKAIKELSEVQAPADWEEKFAQFKKNVEHHAQEEEQMLFPAVKKILSEKELEKIGFEMNKYKQSHLH